MVVYMPRLTYKQKFNKKHGQPLSTANSKARIAEQSKISYNAADRIVKKGEAAFHNNPASVRPFVKYATQWGYARLYSAVMGGAAADKDKLELLRGRREFKSK